MNPFVTRVSCSAPRLRLLDRQGDFIATASGAFFRSPSGVFLVSNWHVFTGCDAQSRNWLSSRPPFQAEIEYRILPDGVTALARKATIRIWDETSTEWLFTEHPQFHNEFDVAAIKLPDEHFSRALCCNEDIKPGVAVYGPGDDLMILGYPKGLSGGIHYPIWKRGSIASETTYSNEGPPRCLIDSATADGMSGAPVLFRSNAYMIESDNLPHGEYGYTIGATVQEFVGIYSGRLSALADEPMGAQLGVVWLRKGVEEVVVAASVKPSAPMLVQPHNPSDTIS